MSADMPPWNMLLQQWKKGFGRFGKHVGARGKQLFPASEPVQYADARELVLLCSGNVVHAVADHDGLRLRE